MPEPKENFTTIRVSKETLKEFNAEGMKSESSDALLKRILRELREYQRRCG